MKKNVFRHLFLAAIFIEGGTFTPFYGLNKDQKNVSVASFRIDKYPVTNKEFFEFIETHSAWRKDKVSLAVSDRDYLKHWDKDQPSAKQWNVPQTYVSWYAAQEYCKEKGGRLPTVFEWEYVGSASETQKDASKDPKFIQKLLEWYSKPVEEGKIPVVGQGKPNAWGVYDMHGVIWEWVYDFNSVFVTGDNRQDKDKLKNLFCGAGSEWAQNRLNYAAFMRYALRSSLKAPYTLMNLGFRCAYNEKDKVLGEQGDLTPFQLSHYKPHFVVATMTYTSCQWACPLIMKKLKTISKALGRDAKDVEFVVVTFDPTVDTSSRLLEYKKSQGVDFPNWHFLSSSEEETRKTSLFLDISYQKDMATGHFMHSNKIILLNPEGQKVVTLDGLDSEIAPLLKAMGKAPKVSFFQRLKNFLLLFMG